MRGIKKFFRRFVSKLFIRKSTGSNVSKNDVSGTSEDLIPATSEGLSNSSNGEQSSSLENKLEDDFNQTHGEPRTTTNIRPYSNAIDTIESIIRKLDSLKSTNAQIPTSRAYEEKHLEIGNYSSAAVVNSITEAHISSVRTIPERSFESIYKKRVKEQEERFKQERIRRRKAEKEKIRKKKELDEKKKLEKAAEEALIKKRLQEDQYYNVRFNNLKLQETGTVYAQKIENSRIDSFNQLRRFSRQQSDMVHDSLQRGVAVLSEYYQLEQYIFALSRMHQLKLIEAFDGFNSKGHLDNTRLSLIDWGCGQGLASTIFKDYINEHNIATTIENIILLDASELSVKRGVLHLNKMFEGSRPAKINIHAINLNEVNEIHLKESTPIFFHFFSNILDIEELNLHTIFEAISKHCKGENLFVTTSPTISAYRTQRLNRFQDYFEDTFGVERIAENSKPIKHPNGGKDYTRYELSFKAYIT